MSEELLPRRFGRYVLLAELARGGMGQTYVASFGEPARLCVLKVISSDIEPEIEDELSARFDAETQIMIRLSCPNIVSVLEGGRHEGEPFLAMELVEGCDLAKVAARARERGVQVPVTVAVFIVREIVRALHYLHTHREARIIHRDVAPMNIMVAYSGEVKLIDFGIAKRATDQTMTVPGQAHGHFGYMAPERYYSKPYDHRADLYSAGVILWELLTGEQWFFWPEDSQGKTYGSPPHRRKALPPPSEKRSDIDRRLDEMVAHSAAPDPGDRFADADGMRVALAEYLAAVDPAFDWGGVKSFLASLFAAEAAAAERHRQDWIALANAITPPTAPILVAPSVVSAAEKRETSLKPSALARGRWMVGVGSVSIALVAGAVSLPIVMRARARGGPPHPAPTEQFAPRATQAPPTLSPPERPTPTPDPASGRPGTAASVVARGETRAVRHEPRVREVAPPVEAENQPHHAASGAGDGLVSSARDAIQTGNYLNAVELGKRALQEGGDKLGAHMVLATTYFLLLRFPDARKHYESALRIDPTNEEAARGLANAIRKESE